MNIEKCIMVLLAAILTLSVVGIADENATKVNITVISKSVDIDKSSNQETVLIYIESSKTGRLNYIESYFYKNDTGIPDLDRAAMYYNDTLTNNTLTLRIKRPLDKLGNPYRLIVATIFIDNNKEFETWFKFTNNDDKKSPGFETIVVMISIIFAICISKKRGI